MAHSVRVQNDTAQVEAPRSRRERSCGSGYPLRHGWPGSSMPSSPRLSSPASFQVFFAGMGAFGADWSYHVTLAHFLGSLPLLMVPAAFVGRLPWALRLLPLGLVFLIGAQYALAHAAVPAAALHPVNGFLILLTSLFIARRAWAAVRRKG